MFTTRARQGTHPLLGARNATARRRRSVAVLAALIVGLLASAATVPAAFAMIPDPGDAPGSAGVRRSRHPPSAWLSRAAWRAGRSLPSP